MYVKHVCNTVICIPRKVFTGCCIGTIPLKSLFQCQPETGIFFFLRLSLGRQNYEVSGI